MTTIIDHGTSMTGFLAEREAKRQAAELAFATASPGVRYAMRYDRWAASRSRGVHARGRVGFSPNAWERATGTDRMYASTRYEQRSAAAFRRLSRP
jgi:hypothetical protein